MTPHARLPRRSFFAGIAVGFVLTAAAVAAVLLSGLLPMESARSEDADGTTQVRVLVRERADERIEVSVQSRDAAGEWMTATPDRRFLPAERELDVWHSSSAVGVGSASAAAVHPGIGELGPYRFHTPSTSPEQHAPDTLFCFVTHGTPDDFFWQTAYNGALTAAQQLGVRLRGSMNETGPEQAAAIRQCVADGAEAIASTIADPEAVVPALQEASKAGVAVITFNSGSLVRGISTHISLDEPGLGRAAARAFADLGVEGDLLCIIHETVNIGLTERCEGLASAWTGDVHTLNISDEPDRPATIAAALAEHQVGAILTLNANTALLALESMQSVVSDEAPVLGTVGLGFPVLSALLSGELAFSITDAPQTQSYLTVMALRKAWGEAFSIDAFAGLGRNIQLETRLLTSAALIQIAQSFVQALGPDDPFAIALNALIAGEGDAQSFSRGLVEIIEGQ